MYLLSLTRDIGIDSPDSARRLFPQSAVIVIFPAHNLKIINQRNEEFSRNRGVFVFISGSQGTSSKSKQAQSCALKVSPHATSPFRPQQIIEHPFHTDTLD